MSKINAKPPQFPVRCADTGCEEEISREQAELLFRSDDEVQTWYQLEIALSAMPMVRSCLSIYFLRDLIHLEKSKGMS
jgi:hypothetical protein